VLPELPKAQHAKGGRGVRRSSGRKGTFCSRRCEVIRVGSRTEGSPESPRKRAAEEDVARGLERRRADWAPAVSGDKDLFAE
jgi:hypothetical protein